MDNQNNSKKISKFFTIFGISFLLLVTIVFIYIFFSNTKDTNSIVKSFSLIQSPSVPGESIKWIKKFKVSAINSEQSLLEIPRIANNINFSVLKENINISTQKDLTNIDRKKLSDISKDRINSPESVSLAKSIKQQKEKGILAFIRKIFSKAGSMFAAVEEAVVGTSTSDTVLIDLSVSSSTVSEDVVVTAELPNEILIEDTIATSTEVIISEISTTTEDNLIETEEIVNEISTTSDGNPVDDEEIIFSATSTESTSSVQSEPEITPAAVLQASSSDSISVEYETPAPTIAEANTDTGKIVTISAEDTSEEPITNVLAYTNIPEIYKVGQENKIKIKWTNNNDKNVTFKAYDLNGNGKLDYVEWTVPHLSVQTFEIIFISKALLLDENQNIIDDVYDQVKTQDGDWINVLNGQYIHTTFQTVLTSKKDITIYARPVDFGVPIKIEVYAASPSNGSEYNGDTNKLLATFNVDSENRYKVFLSKLQSPTDVFDLKVIGGSADIDYIVDPTGWLTDWPNRKKITISNTNIDSDLTDFPALVKITNDLNMSVALSSGYDIRFTDSGGLTLLKYEREEWTGGGGSAATGTFWVKVPTISTGTTTDIYIYYGNSSASSDWTADGTPTNAQQVWGSNFSGVWHLNNPASPTDSTNNGNGGTNNGVTATIGKIAGAGNFDGSQYVTMGSNNFPAGSSSRTISAWVNAASFPAWANIFGYGTASGNNGFAIGLTDNGVGTIVIGQYGFNSDTSTSNISSGNWQYVSGVYDGSSVSFYINGLAAGGGIFNGVNTILGSLHDIGKGSDWGASNWTGKMDEVRISPSVLSADWIKFEYYNQNSATNELTIGPDEKKDGNYIITTFRSSGTFTPIEGVTSVEVLVVAGGGGGGSGAQSANNGGGGGAGGLVYDSAFIIASQDYSVTVGDGGLVDENGEDSVFDTITAVGGGHGGGLNPAVSASVGGSGGGQHPFGGAGAVGTSGQGNSGGAGLNASPWRSGGGGGAGLAGADGVTGSNGGDGLSYDISGVATYYAGGGAGTGDDGGGIGGLGGGGNGAVLSGPIAEAGDPNTGGGGGGGVSQGSQIVAAGGGSGIVIVKYLLPSDKYWVGTDGNWNDANNWASVSGGSDSAGVPGVGETVIFDGGGTGNANINVNVNVFNIEINSGYTGTINQSLFYDVNISGNFLQNDGIFNGGLGDISVSGDVTLSGGSFKSTSGDFSIEGNFVNSGNTFDANNGTVIFTGVNSNINSGSTVFYKVVFSGGVVPITATGGTITTDGPYNIHTFTGNGTFVAPVGGITAEVLVVAGGGSGGGSSGSSIGSGGGGGGGVIYNPSYLISQGSKPVTVGEGGIGQTGFVPGRNGGNSTFVALTAIGGGYGGTWDIQSASGGSGGGAGENGQGYDGGTGTLGQGFAGGNDNGYINGVESAGAGGGGASQAGFDSVGDIIGGAGGDGVTYNISGSSVVYGGGGGGSGSVTFGAGGAGGGGDGRGVLTGTGTAGTANTGGGGGGSLTNGGEDAQPGGNGGSGIVIIKYLTASLGTYTLSGDLVATDDITINTTATLNASSSNISVGGNWSNSGTFNANTGTINFTGTTAISGTSENTFNNINITGALTAPVGNINVAGNWINSGTFNANTGTINITGDDSHITPGGSSFYKIVFGSTPSVATGGTITTDGDYNVHTFTSDGIFNVLDDNINVDILVVAGGGGGGSNGGGGGGGGGYQYNNNFIATPQIYSVVVGNGGGADQNGFDSSFSTITAIGGGAGGGNNSNGATGGCGGGAGTSVLSLAGGLGTQGMNGGNNDTNGPYYGGGGGGGVNTIGENATSGVGGNGGDGITNSISGSAVTYGGGGGGAVYYSGGIDGQGGIGGGGDAGTSGFSGIANTGGGGGGARGGSTAGAGGSGIVIIKYLTASLGTYTLSGDLVATDDITINTTATLNASSSNISVGGNWSNSGTFNANTGTINFTGTTAISGTSENTFNNINITGALTAPVGNINVAGNWINSGTFNANTGTINFTGTTAISGTSENTFNNINITGALTAPSGNLNIAGDWTNSGTFNANNGTVIFTEAGGHLTPGGAAFYKVEFTGGEGENPATGGLISTEGDYTLHTYTDNGTFSSSEIMDADVYVWGAGGAGGTPGGWVFGSPGGAGGAASGTVRFSSSTYSIVVGGGGIVNSIVGANGGGGAASHNNEDNRYSGGGGGYSGIFLSSVSQLNAIIIAGGGGGGGSSRAGTGNAGGAGGGSSGQVGFSPYDGKPSYGGNPGTQSEAGANSSTDFVNGGGGQGALQGGVVRSSSYGGGGGGGYWGGSAGGYSEGNTMGGGGGGSGYFNPTYVTSGSLTVGSGTTPGDSTNYLRVTAGNAGGVSGNGSSGKVIIKYLTITPGTTLSGNLVATNDITINSGSTLTAGTHNISVGGNWSNSGTFNANTGTINFTGTTAISGTSENTFNNINITGALTAPVGNINVAGNWINSGTFNANTGTINITGDDSHITPGGSSFYKIVFGSTPSVATGGTITTDGDYNVHTFTSDGIFNMSQGSITADVFVVGGGGGGGAQHAGGGGGGGVIETTYAISESTDYTVTIGAGGDGGTVSVKGTSGGNSIFGSLTAVGGGGGGSRYNPDALSGGSGGGAGHGGIPGSGVSGQGFAGGSSFTGGGNFGGGGGGGATSVGENGTGSTGGNGGAGYTTSISGSSICYAGGGGAGTWLGGTAGTATCGGRAGDNTHATPADAIANFGGGGGASGGTSDPAPPGGKGGSGIVIVRYLTTSSGSTTLSGNLVATNDITINSGSTLTAGTHNISVGGNWINSGTFNANTGTINFTGTTAISGTSENTFNNINITGALTAPSGNLNIAGDWTNSGTFNANTGTINITGDDSHITPGGSSFYKIVFGGTAAVATGGTITTNGNYRVHTFTSSGTFTPSGTINVEALVVAGGGSGGGNCGGGGGGGGVIYNSAFPVSAQSYSVTVGSGAAPFDGTGGGSIFSTIITTGGGRGAASDGNISVSGGSGGGGAAIGNSGASGIVGQGYEGGDGILGTYYIGGGGGGAGTVGDDANDTTGYAGNGGDGYQSDISGVNTYYGGGGGGGGYGGNNSQAGTGGLGGGGNGDDATQNAGQDGIDGLGGGGGGGSGGGANIYSSGGSGIVIVRYLTTSSGSTTLSGNLVATNDITINSGSTLTAGTHNISVGGNWINSGTFNANTGTINFTGTTAISGTSENTFNNINITGALTAPSGNLNIAGDWTNSGTFNANTGTINFTGTTAISGTSENTFNNINISGVLTATTGNLNITGDWTNSGTFNAGGGEVVFNGTSQSITGETIFYDFTKIVTSADTLTFDSNSNTIIPSGGTFTITGVNGNVLSLRSSTGADRWDLNVNNSATVVADYIDVMDSDASAGKEIVSTNYMDSGNNINWLFDISAPTINIFSPLNNFYSSSTSIYFNASASDTGLGFIVPNLDSTLISWWRMDDVDLFENPNDYIGVNNGTAYGGTSQVFGKFGKGFSFDGTDAYISVPNFIGQPTTFTVSHWIYLNANQVSRTIFSNYDGNGGGWVTGISDSNANVIKFYLGAGNNLFSNSALLNNTWYHVAVTYDNGNPKLYINGSLDNSSNQIITYGGVSGANDIGHLAPNNVQNFNGFIDEVMIFNRALNTDEITSLYNGSDINHSSVLTEGVHTYKIFSADISGNVSSSSNTFTVDITPPVISNINPVSGTTILSNEQLITLNLNKFGDCRLSTSAKSYDDMSGDTICSTNNGVQISCIAPALPAGTQDLYIACEDYLGNKDSISTVNSISYVVPSSGRRRPVETGTGISGPNPEANQYSMLINNGAVSTNSRMVTLSFSSSTDSDATAIVLATNPDFYNARIIPFSNLAAFDVCYESLSCSDSIYTIYAKLLNPYGIAYPVISAKIDLNATPLIVEIIDKAKEVIGGISSTTVETIKTVLPKPKEDIVVKYPDIEVSVPEDPQYVFRGQWKVDLSSLLNNFVFASLPNDFKDTIQKFPDLTSLLAKVGINKMTDVGALTTAKIYLPNLSEVIGSAGKNIEIASISKSQGSKIPNDIVFVRTADQKIDLSVKLSLSNNGLTLKTVNTIQGKPLSFIIKPERPAKSIEGYLIFKSTDINTVSANKNIKGMLQTATVFTNDLNKQSTESVNNNMSTEGVDLVLSKFEYKENENGIWTAEVPSPQVIGQYELRTIVNFKEKSKSPEKISMIIVVDPEGYVYEKLDDGREVRMKGTEVSIYWENPGTMKYELWPAKDYRQENPQITDVTGRYSFLVPVGKYYLKAHINSYTDYESEPFEVQESKGVFMNIELKPITSPFFKIFNIQNILLALVGIFILLMYLGVFLESRRRNNY